MEITVLNKEIFILLPMKYPILLPNIFNHPFTYESDLKLKTGDFVIIPFGKSKLTGVVWDNFEINNNKKFKLKKILRKLKNLQEILNAKKLKIKIKKELNPD